MSATSWALGLVALVSTVFALYFALRRNPLLEKVEEFRQLAAAKEAQLGVATSECERLRHELSSLRVVHQDLLGLRGNLEASLANSQGRSAETEAALAQEREQLGRAQLEATRFKDEASQKFATLQGNYQGLGVERDSLRQQLEAQKAWILEQTQHFREAVLLAAGQMMEERGKELSERNRKDVDSVVAPFKDQLVQFRQRVDEIHSAEAREQGSLKQQIEQLTTMNQAMSAQAERLVNALTITTKSVGDWGETILEKILEESGLRSGHEFNLQMSILGRNGERLIPDAVIHLPESRHLVVDAKVSNKAWTDYCDAQDDEAREVCIKAHLTSLRAHMKALAGRGYADSPELSTVDFVLMFVPVEAALLTAFVKDESLYSEAYRARIILVSPSTLMAVVKLVEGLWTLQRRKESADEIAEAGRKLYEKLTNFAETFVEVGASITKAGEHFEKAKGQLSTGRGNAIGLAEKMVALGVTPTTGKAMPAVLVTHDADADTEDGA